jgi:rod shape-determining protein MreB
MSGLGIDLGTANTVVCHGRYGVVYQEPSVLVREADGRRRVISVGTEAKTLLGRTPQNVAVVRPLQDGVITDLEGSRTYLRAVLHRLPAKLRLRARVAIGVPLGATALERRGLLEAADEAHVAKAVLVPEQVAGAMGCGVDPMEPRAHMVVDIGGGTAEVTAFCYGGVLASRSTRVAGDEMTLAVYEYLRHQYQLVVGELVAEDLKIRAATEESPSLVVEGQDAATGRPRFVTLDLEEIGEALRPVTSSITQTLAACLEDLPPQSVSDINAEGVLTFGGGSLLRGLDTLLEDAFGFPVRRAERPLTCVAEGAVAVLSRPDVASAYGG